MTHTRPIRAPPCAPACNRNRKHEDDMTADNIEWGEWVEGRATFPLPDHWQMVGENGRNRHRIGKPRAPVVTEQVLYWQKSCAATLACHHDTHRITITLHDGEPVGIKIEALK